MISEPLVFEPIAMERVWGGRRFENLKGKALPHSAPIGELWEVVDRADAQSVVHEGSFAGLTLHELWTKNRRAIFGKAAECHSSPRFPILIKLLDARERLSVQVHPPAHLESVLQGEAKTEVWYFLDAQPGARIYAGLKKGVTRDEFESLLHSGAVEQALHEIEVFTGESIFIPSGRLHAIGEGNLIVEVQQNSDTTYRVFDWNRMGLDGQPRALHIKESLLSIDFADFEPGVTRSHENVIADCPYFRVEKQTLTKACDVRPAESFAVVTLLDGTVKCGSAAFERGQFFLVPASAENLTVEPLGGTAGILVSTLPA